MIKGKYVGTVTIEFSIDENCPTLLAFDEIKEQIKDDLNCVIANLIEDEIGEEGKVTVEQKYADVWKE